MALNEEEQHSRSGGIYNVFLFKLHKDYFLYADRKVKNNVYKWLWSPQQVKCTFRRLLVSL
ncbi:hypothetical protein EO98_10105 [Methanosarcina sp. 2.H.T.1A.6]|nr:hypothetical protein EO97_07425 [Methanosarcina sp. 2.H.T.1A.15]KKG14300.1 hypothetical protein EO94_16485 [Methanosarcina sp. 2.H.T.1A.3]KKG19790.1 hypothetical protein EO98_10105 [Methanosarcina sp. 2.H.T.1A.6]KKG27177.1 hypothetical protein EO96_09510 [Methanosarcina sp. 2.H.T.1A.8]